MNLYVSLLALVGTFLQLTDALRRLGTEDDAVIMRLIDEIRGEVSWKHPTKKFQRHLLSRQLLRDSPGERKALRRLEAATFSWGALVSAAMLSFAGSAHWL